MHAHAAALVGVLMFASGAAVHLQAQVSRGTLAGRVVDRAGTPVAEAPVAFRNTATDDVAWVLTGRDGRYTVELVAGRYEVTFTLPGSSSRVVSTVRLEAGTRRSANATVGTPEPDEANTELPARTPPETVSGVELQELPLLNRNVTELVALLPGISSDLADEVPFGANGPLRMSVAGTRSSAITWLLDGTSVAHPGRAGGLVVTPSLDAIRGVEVQTGMYDSSQRGGGGGVVGIVTRAGSSRMSGSVYGFVRSDALRSSAFATRRGSLGREYTRVNPRLRHNDAGFTVGGPFPGGQRAHLFVSEQWRHRSAASISVRANVPDPSWLTDPSSPHYVPPAERDPNAVKLLAAWPAPNVPGASQYAATYRRPDDTRQDVLRLDFIQTPAWRWTGRYSRDRNTTFHPGGYRFGSPDQIIKLNTETNLDTVGSLAGAEAQGVWSRLLARVSYQRADHRLTTSLHKGLTNTRSAFGISIPELSPSNTGNRIPSIDIEGVMGVASPIPPALRYREHEVSGEVVVERGPHTIRSGALVAVEDEEEDSNCQASPGVFYFGAGGGYTGFQNFLRGNRDGSCEGNCAYFEDVVEVKNRFSLGRYEVYVQDTWRLGTRLTIDLGLRYSLYPPITDDFNRLVTFSPRAYDPAAAPAFADPYGWETVPGTGNPLNGLYVAGQTSPYGRALYGWDKNNLQPRVSAAWAPGREDRTVVRAGYGVYYDRPSAGLFAAQYLDPVFGRQIGLRNPQLSNPAAGEPQSPSELVWSRPSISDPFLTPRTERWTVGLSRRLYGRGIAEIGYVGTRGRHQIRSVDINQPQLTAIVDPEILNPVRPYLGYDSIVVRETTGRSRYDGLLASFRHSGGRAGSFTANYTLSRSMADASCECSDLPQNPLDKDAEYSTAQTDRTHVLNVFYVYELPFFRDHRHWLARAALSGWQVAGITRVSSGPPARVTYLEAGSPIPRRANLVGDPAAGRQPFPFWFDPAAFAPPAAGAYGDAAVSPFRLPGRHQWDMSISKNFLLSSRTRLQLRADVINVFNHTQYLGVRTTCFGDRCESPRNEFGTITSAHAPRQAQLGVKLYW